MPNGGFRLVIGALEAYRYEPDPQVVETFTRHRKTHNESRWPHTAGTRRMNTPTAAHQAPSAACARSWECRRRDRAAELVALARPVASV